MRIELYDEEKHWETIRGWWDEAPPLQIIPPVGAVCYDGDMPLAAAWLRMSNADGVCYLEQLISNPGGDPHRVGASLRVVTFLEEHAKSLDYTVMFLAVSNDTITKKMQRLAYEVAASGMIHLFKPL